MKKLCFFIVFFIFASATTLLASEVNVTVDGAPVNFPDGQGAVIVDGRTLVPVRGVFETLGFDVEWDGDTRTAILTGSEYVLRITVDSDVFTVNGESRTLDVPARIINGRTMVPIRLPLESVGINVGWDAATSTVLIGESPVSVQGVGWSGNVFTSESLGIRFTMPSGWEATDDDELRASSEAMSVLVQMEFILMAGNPETGASINIYVEPAESGITAAQYNEAAIQQISELLGAEIGEAGTIRLGRYDWYMIGWSIEDRGSNGRTIVNIQDGYVRVITMASSDDGETPDDIIAMFSSN